MSDQKKKIEISIEGDASSLDKATQQSQGFINRVKVQIALLITQLKIAGPEFFSMGHAAVTTMTNASIAAVGLMAHLVSLGVQLWRLTANYLGLTIGLDTNSTKMELARKGLEKYHVETRISLGFLKNFSDALRAINFPIQPLINFIDKLAKMDVVLGIGRGKNINIFDELGKSIDRARGMLSSLNTAVDAYSNQLKTRLGKLVAVFTVEALINWRGVKFDSAFSEVRKVVDGTREQLGKLRKELLDMSTEVSTPVEGLTQMAAIAGQMGIPTAEIKEFTQLISKSGVAFGLLPEIAASAMGKLRAIYGLGAKDLEYFGDQINYVADNAKGAVSESGLMDVVTNAGETAKGFGLLRSETIAMGAALLQTGKEPEKVSTAIRNLLVSLQTAEQGTKPFRAALQQLGIDTKQLANDIESDPKKALDDFLLKIKELDARGQTSVLAGMFGKGEDTEVIKTLVAQFDEYQRLVKAAQSDAVAGSMDRTFKEKEATAMAALNRLKNTVYALAVVASDIFLPAIVGVTNGLSNLVKWLKALNEENPNAFAFIRIASIFGIIGTVLRLAFGTGALGLIKTFVTTAVAYFSGGFLSGIRAAIIGLPALFGVVFQTAIGRVLGGAALLMGALNVIPAAIGAISTAISFLAGSPIALLVAALSVLAIKMLVPGAAMAGLRSGAALLGRGLLFLVGGPIGLTISALAFLFVKYNEVKDVVFKFGSANVTLSEILSAVWRLITRMFTDAGDIIGETLAGMGKRIQAWFSISDATLDSMKSSVNGFLQHWTSFTNSWISVFDGAVAAISTAAAVFVQHLATEFRQAVALAQAAARDIKAAFTNFDLSGTNIKQTLATNAQQDKAQSATSKGAIGEAYKSKQGINYIGSLADNSALFLNNTKNVVVDYGKRWQEAVNREVIAQRKDTGATARPKETRPTGGGVSLPPSNDDSGTGGSKAGKGGGGGSHGLPKAAQEPQETEMHGFEAALEQRKIAFEKAHALLEYSKADEKLYWDDIIAKYKGNDKTLADLKKKSADLDLQIIRENAQKKQDLLKESQQAAHDAAMDALTLKQADAQQQYDLGNITQAQLLDLEKQYARESYAIALKLAQEKRDLTLAGTVDRAQAEDAILQITRDYAKRDKDIAHQQVLERKRQFDQLFSPLQNAIDQSVNGILSGQNTLKNSLRNMAQSITISYIQESLKHRAILMKDWLFQKLGYADVASKKKQIDLLSAAWDGIQWLGKKARIAAGWAWEVMGFGAKEASKTATVVASEAVQTGAKLTSDAVTTASHITATETKDKVTLLSKIKTVFAAAIEAAAFSYQSFAAIPFVGWALAPAAAAVAFAAVMAFGSIGSAKGGEWEVNKDGSPYILHEKESVLPASAAEGWRKMVGYADSMMSPDKLVGGAVAQAKAVITGDRLPKNAGAFAADLMRTGALAPQISLPANLANLTQFKQQIDRNAQKSAANPKQEPKRKTVVTNKHVLHIHPLGANEIIRAGKGEIVKVLHEEHRNFNTTKK